MYHNQPEIRLTETEPMQYLLGNAPSWMMRYGITAVACCLSVLLMMSYFIRYPDVVETTVILTTQHPPIRIKAPIDGRIIYLPGNSGDHVEAGQVLAVLESGAHWADVQILERWLAQADSGFTPPPGVGLGLGEIQTAYASYCRTFVEYQFLVENGHLHTRVQGINAQIEQIRMLNQNIRRQNEILKTEFELTTREKERIEQLYRQQVVSESEAEKQTAVWLQQKRQIESAESVYLSNQLQIEQLESQISNLQLGHAEQNENLHNSLSEQISAIRSALADWKRRYLIVAPISGILSFQKIWSAQQGVSAGDEVMAILPHQDAKNTGRIIGKAGIAGPAIGQVSAGCRGIIRLDAYPYQQFGSLECTVTQIERLPSKEEYAIDVQLNDDSLRTNAGQVLPFRQELTGTIRLITSDRRVISRIFSRFSGVFE